MLHEVRQYRATCDTTGCKSATGCHHNQTMLYDQMVAAGWEMQGSGPTVHRCAKCVAAHRYPSAWITPAVADLLNSAMERHGTSGS